MAKTLAWNAEAWMPYPGYVDEIDAFSILPSVNFVLREAFLQEICDISVVHSVLKGHDVPSLQE